MQQLKQLKLEEYPRAIATLSYRIYSLNQTIDQIETNIELTVAFDTSLKNDDQRKARRAELRLSNEALVAAKEKRSRSEIKLAFLRDSFAVERLQARERISLTAAFSLLD